MTNLQQLGQIVKHFRENTGKSQRLFAEELKINRTAIAHLEQGRQIPNDAVLESICKNLNIPKVFYQVYIEPEHSTRFKFENVLCELVGTNVSLETLNPIEIEEAEKHIKTLFSNSNNQNQIYDNFNRCLIFYGVKKISNLFFERYLNENTFQTLDSFKSSVIKYQEEVIRIFSTYSLAYQELNKDKSIFQEHISNLNVKPLDNYKKRNEWTCIKSIPNIDLPLLGYVSALKVKDESIKRTQLIEFIDDLAYKFGAKGKINKESLLKHYDIKRINKMDSLLRKFNTKFEHSLVSSLFEVDVDFIIREKKHLAPKGEQEIIKIKAAQDQGFANLSNYLTADYMDLYIATSMRTDGDFISVNDFIEKLIKHDMIKDLKLRYFNPTQSWIDDRVAKGLVEALMLKRADITIYMAQKSDTFGKDSEASVSLGQGKPVIVYIPKLKIEEINLDSEKLSFLDKMSLNNLLTEENKCDEANSDCDEQALLSAVINQYLNDTTDEVLINAVKKYWAEFDFITEEDRIKNDNEDEEFYQKKEYRDFFEKIKSNDIVNLSSSLRKNLINNFIAITVRFEQRSKVFKEIHPLALQVILSTGVLNGILVSRSLESCAELLYGLLENSLALKLEEDEYNYKLLEERTGSVVRVISKNILLTHAFEQFYKFEG